MREGLANHLYGTTPGQLGNEEANDFWSAALQVGSQTVALLSPGAHAIWVTKDYVRHGAIVPFTRQWAALCEQAGFVWLHHHQAMLVEDHGTELSLFGEPVTRRTERKSFFRRLHEKKRPDLAIHYESVLCFVKPGG